MTLIVDKFSSAIEKKVQLCQINKNLLTMMMVLIFNHNDCWPI